MLPAQCLHLLRKMSLLGLVRQHASQTPSPGGPQLFAGRQQGRCPAAVRAIGRGRYHGPKAATCSAEHLALAALAALVGLEAPLPTQAWGHLDALRVD